MNHLPPIQLSNIPKFSYRNSDYDDNKGPPVKNYGIAISYYSSGLNKDKTNKDFLIKRAICYFAKGYYNLCLKDALSALKIDPKGYKAYYYATLCYGEMYDIVNAEKYNCIKDFRGKVGINKTKNELKSKGEKYSLYSKYVFFVKELYKSNAFFPKVEIKFYSNDNRGVCSRSYIHKEEIIMSIPNNCLISLEVASETEIGKQIKEFMYKELQSPKHCLLSSFLLSEADNEKWKFYFDLLPKDFTNFPIFYTSDELGYLKGSPFLSQILDKHNDIQNDYNKICEHIPAFTQYSYLDFGKARMLISSRIFGISINNVNTDVLAPYADLLNHKPTRQTQWYYDDSKSAFVIQAIEDIPENSEIFDSYGQKTNPRFLGNYGFALENNDCNEYPFTVKFNEECPGFEVKKRFFRSEIEYLQLFTLNNNFRDSHLTELLSFLRFLLFEGDLDRGYSSWAANNVFFTKEDIGSCGYYTSAIDRDLEIKVGKYFKSSLEDLGKEYPTTYEEDMVSVKEKGISFNKKNCLLGVMSEKSVLSLYKEFCVYCLELLEMKSEIAIIERITTDYQTRELQFDFYINDVIGKVIQMEKEDDSY